MQLLCLLIFIGVAQCDDSTLLPASYDNLGVPNAVEYVSYYQLSVQTSYITSVECMLSSSNYIQSGFLEIDSSSNDLTTNLITEFKNDFGSLENMMFGLQSDVDKDSQDKLNSVLYMTTTYYQNKEVTVQKTETTLGQVTEKKQAKSVLTARRCESEYINFMNEITTIKSKYNGGSINADNINNDQWANLVKQYYDARQTVVKNTNVYTSIRDAFLLGRGINMCEGSQNTDQSLLDIYKTDDLSTYFGKNDNNASALFSQTVTQMYTIYKNSLTVIYLKSVVHSESDLAMRVTMWEQVNLVRANFEYMSQNIDMFITTTTTEAQSTYNVDSDDYKKIMIRLYTCVNKMLITVVKSTEVHYKRALNFNSDGSMITTDYNQYKVDTIDTYYKNILWSNTNAARYDMRLINEKDCSLPTPDMCIPQNMYSLQINKLFFQTCICQINNINVQIKTTEYDKSTVDYWMYDKITIIELKYSFLFSKCSVTVNKMFIINSATYTYILMTTDQTDQSNQSTAVQKVLDQTKYDVVGTLCIHTLEITDTSNTVSIFINTNSNNTNGPSTVYKPPTTTPPPPINSTGTPSSQPSSGTPPSSPKSPETPPSSSESPETPPSSSESPETPPGSPESPGTPTRLPSYPTGTYSLQPGSPGGPGSTGSTGNSTYIGNDTNMGASIDARYKFVTAGTQITQSVQNYQNSIEEKITINLKNLQNSEQNNYSKVVIKSLEISQQIFQSNIGYLNNVTSDSLQYISQVTTPGSQEYLIALIVLYRDTEEKITVLSSTMEIPLKRTIYPSTSNEYNYVSQSVDYSEFVKYFYQYFKVKIEEIYNTQNDAELFLTNSVTQFNKICETISTAVQKLPDDTYKTFLLNYLQNTLTVYKQTTDYFRQQIVETQQFICETGDNSKSAFYKEITQRMDSINVLYSGVLIKSYQYSMNSSSVSIYESEYDIVTVQTTIVSSYTKTVYSKSQSGFEVEISN